MRSNWIQYPYPVKLSQLILVVSRQDFMCLITAEKVGTSVRLKTVVFYKAWEYISGNAVFTQVKKQS